jgi:phosphohistidine phosphatase
MKSLYLVRHAKSSWDNPSLEDISRPLNERGYKDAQRMGEELKRKGVEPDWILSSPAIRALTTAQIMASVMGYSELEIWVEPSLYGSDVDTLFRVFRRIANHHDVVFSYGHNPITTIFANVFEGGRVDNVPTCGIVRIDFEVDNWLDIDIKNGVVVLVDSPKQYKSYE